MRSTPTANPSSASAVEVWPIAKLVPYEKNPRKNDSAVDRMCASIEEFGFGIPCLVRSDGEVIDGHLRLKSALMSQASSELFCFGSTSTAAEQR